MFYSFRKAVTLARQQGDLYFAALLDEQRILEAFGSASYTLARLDLLARAHGLGLPLAMFESGSFLSRRGCPTGGLAGGSRPRAVLVRDECLLHRARRSSRGGLSRAAAPHGPRTGSGGAGRMALAGA